MSQRAWLEFVKSVSKQGLNISPSILTIGRAADNDLVLNDIAVSRYHARIERVEAGYVLVDVGSKAGTRLNDAKLQSNTPHPLTDGDLITFGNSALRFRLRWQHQDEGQTTTQSDELFQRNGQVPVLEVNTRKWSQNWGMMDAVCLLGSHPACDIAVEGVDIAPCHLRIRDCGHYLAITDLTELLSTSETLLQIGDEYELADKTTVMYMGLEYPQQIDRQPRQLFFLPPTEINPDVKATLLTPNPQAVATATVPIKTLSLVGNVEFTIGRDPANHLQISHPTVSRFQAKIEHRGREFILTDLGSSNGTYINGRRVSEPTLLRVGDSIRIGCERFVLNIDETLTQYSESGHLRLDAIHLNRVVGKEITILHDLSLSILPKEFVAILGASGSGKSTLLDALNGLRPATTGLVLVNGTNFYRNYQAYQTQLGYVPQRNIIHEELSVAQALDYAARLRMPPDTTPNERAERVQAVLNELGLSHRRHVPISRLSGGQQRRVCIGAELLTQPSLFFLDEATSGLDPGTEADMMFLLRQLADQGRTILLITHATQNIRECDLVIYMAEGGRLAYFGPPEQMLSYFRSTFTEEFAGLKLDDFSGIYRALDQEKNPQAPTPQALEQAFRDSQLYQDYVVARQTVLQNIPDEPPKRTQNLQPVLRNHLSAWQQFLILTRRNLVILSQDRSNLALTLLIAPLLGMLGFVSWQRDVFDPLNGNAGLALTMIFVTTLIAVMIGAMTTMRDLVKEVEIYRRERMIGLQLVPYVGSKVAIALVLALYQAATYLLVTKLAVDIPGDWGITFAMFITLATAIFGGMAMGLLVSAFAPSQNIVPLLILMFLVPQIIFSGGIQPVDSFGWPGQVINHLTVIKWPFESMVTLTGLGEGIATDPCWQELTEAQRDNLTEAQQRSTCTCYGPGLFQTCNFPGIRAKYVPQVDEPEPTRPPAPAFPTNPANFPAYQAQMDQYQADLKEWEDNYSEWNRQRSRAINEAEGTLNRFNQDQGYMFNVNVRDHWRNQGLLILVMLVAVPFFQRQRDFTK
ncbi:FHA domain-containing protein [Synechococcus sp. PCC 6312]|uniref:FHA domain-containing protein n=1 Tax=Synechococcus sp. (strain ATCC 27167 / PCC 6312) TaxID=195253 RepID=UPI00029F0CF2|nr:FHA domain-containing protein [Synechococcus sp. PCC 6312]AFY61378.1 ABC-type multidrug transport system, ATPase component [Synechococcus sp. PCC 6312]